LGYAAVLAGSVCAFLVIRHFGNALNAGGFLETPVSAGRAGASVSDTLLPHVLFALVVIVVAARILGLGAKAIGQPAVVGEMIAGILLGPSLLGRLMPQISAFTFPSNVWPFLSVIAQIGVVLFMFLVGIDLDFSLLRGRARSSVAISQASIVAPFLLGSLLALWLYPEFSLRGISFTQFALFTGVAMSVTAFPVLARILRDTGMDRNQIGAVALGCAAADDVTAWCLLALVVGIARSQPGRVFVTLALTVAFACFVLFAVRPAAIWLARKRAEDAVSLQGTVVVVCAALFLASLTTELIGIHAFFGAFLLGLVVPHDSALAKDLRARIEDVVVPVLLPIFFALTGLRTQVGLMHGGRNWMFFAAILAAATIGKFGASYVAGKISGLTSSEAAALGILMNTRGLMELIVLNAGLDLGILPPSLFVMLVLMAIVTTFATCPVLRLIIRRVPELARRPVISERAA
jgi:Kef-type K+ transport system membrane component KefB